MANRNVQILLKWCKWEESAPVGLFLFASVHCKTVIEAGETDY